MAGAVITVDRLERGDLPLVCCKTGERTRLTVRRRHRVIPKWTWALLPLVIPFAVVALLSTHRTMTVSMPMSRRAARRLSLAERAAPVLLFLAVLAGLSIVFDVPLGARLSWAVPAGLLLSTAIAYAASRMLWVGVDLSYTTARLVHLSRLHPRFAEAVGYGPLEVRDLSVSRIEPRRARTARHASRSVTG
jgi:hypothetical protein